MTREILDVQTDGPVRMLTLRRPDRRNALNIDLCRAIHEATMDLAGVRVIVVTGEGTAFCAGADLNGVYGDEFLEALYGMLHHLASVSVPVIAAVNGPAIGAGTQLALACDLRVASDTARFAVPTVRNGMAVDAWTIRTLAEVTGRGVASRLMIAGETIDCDAAVTAGLVDRRGELSEALAWAHEIASLAPLAIAHNKLVLNSGPEADDRIAESFTRVWASEDVAEGARARAEKRTPVFQGR